MNKVEGGREESVMTEKAGKDGNPPIPLSMPRKRRREEWV